jgi:hypothetical protein
MEFYSKVRDRLGPHRQPGFDYIFKYLSGIKDPVIIETGCARQMDNYEGDGQSSILFDRYVSQYGGSLTTIDINADSVAYCAANVSLNTKVIECDSLVALERLRREVAGVDLLYLDSFDAPQDQPAVVFQAAVHHMYEYTTINSALKPGALVCVDDNWIKDGYLHGKGSILAEYFQKIQNKPVQVGYQMLWLEP